MYILWSGEYEHDAEGRRTAFTVNGRRTDYDYAPAGQMTSVSNEVGAFHYTRHPDARLVSALEFPPPAPPSRTPTTCCAGSPASTTSTPRTGWCRVSGMATTR